MRPIGPRQGSSHFRIHLKEAMPVTSTTNPPPNHPDLGRQVRLKSTGNEDKRVWLDNVKGQTKKMVYVLVEERPGRLRSTRVLMTSVAELHTEEPTLQFKAMIQQIPDIERAIEQLAKKIAKCKNLYPPMF